MKNLKSEVVVIFPAKIMKCRKIASCIMRALVEVLAVDFHGVSSVPKNGKKLSAGHQTYSVKTFDSDPNVCSYEYALFIKEDMKSMQTVIEGRKMNHDLLSTVDETGEPVIMAMINWRDSSLIWKNIGVWLFYKPFTLRVLSDMDMFEAQFALEIKKQKIDMDCTNVQIFPLLDPDTDLEERGCGDRQ